MWPRTWNGGNDKLEETERVRKTLAEINERRQAPSAETRATLTLFGERFSDLWNHSAFPVDIKKQIVRAIIEEIIVNDEAGKLSFVVHWKGGSHTALEMEKLTAKTVNRTADADLEVIRKMAVRYGDGEIARVLNKLGRTTGKGKPWSDTAVSTARHNHGIEGRSQNVSDGEVLTLQGAARYTGTSDTTIKKLVNGGVVAMQQVAPFAPWEIRRCDLETERVRAIVEQLKRTGRLSLGDQLEDQRELFQQNQGDDNAR